MPVPAKKPIGRPSRDNAFAIAFGERLKEVRLAAGLSQSDLAELLKSRPNIISRIETGDRVPGFQTIIELAVALGVTTDALRPKGY